MTILLNSSACKCTHRSGRHGHERQQELHDTMNMCESTTGGRYFIAAAVSWVVVRGT